MTAKKPAGGSKIKVRQVRSGICCNEKQKATLRALGLEKLGRVRELPDNPQVRGMVAKIPHLVEIVSVAERSSVRGR
jgi:large subunit ribosomal protein L30